jgi:hypothetical protein
MADLVQEEQQQVVGIDDKRVHLEGGSGQGEKDMGPATGNSIHRSSSRPQLDVSKAEIQSNVEDKYPTILLPNQSDDLSHLALDIGGMHVIYQSYGHIVCLSHHYDLCYIHFVAIHGIETTNSFN